MMTDDPAASKAGDNKDGPGPNEKSIDRTFEGTESQAQALDIGLYINKEKVSPQNGVSAASFAANARENDEFIEYKLRTIMYVKGDVKNPRTDSVKTMQSILRTEMNIVLSEATHIACLGNSEVISHEHILFLMRKNKLKLKRLLEHLTVLDIPHLRMMSFYNAEDDPLPQKNGKRVKKCLEFLRKLGGFREFINNLDDKSLDPTMKMRFERRNLLVKYMTQSEYMEFTAESGRATFCPRQQIWAFKQWLLQSRVTFLNLTPLAVKMIEFLALETIAVIIDTAIHIQAKRLGTGHIFSHLPPIPDFDFAVPKTPKKFLKRLLKRRKEAPDLPSTSGEKTSEVSCASKRRATTQIYSISSDNSDYTCSSSKKLRLNTSVKNSNFETIHKEQSDTNSSSESCYLVIDEASNQSSTNSISSTSNHDLNKKARKADTSDSLLDAQKEESYRRFHSVLFGESSSDFQTERDSSQIPELKTDAKLSSPTDNDVKECNLERDSNSSQNPEQEVSNSDDSIAYHEIDTSSKITDELSSSHNVIIDSSDESCSDDDTMLPDSSYRSLPIKLPKKFLVKPNFNEFLDLGKNRTACINKARIFPECDSVTETQNSTSSNLSTPPKVNPVFEGLENDKSALSTQNDLKGKISLKIDGKVYIVSEKDMKSAYLQKYQSKSRNSSSSLINMKGKTDSPSTFRLVTDVKVSSKRVPITNKAIKKCKTTQKKSTKTAIKCDSVDKACFSNSKSVTERENKTCSQDPLSLSDSVDKTSEIQITLCPVTKAKKDNEPGSKNKDIETSKASLKKAVISVMSDSNNEFSSREQNICSSQNSFSSSICSEGTSSNIPATTKLSVVPQVKNNSERVASADKNVKKYTGSLKRDAVICPISPDSEVELPGPEQNINSPHSSISSSATSEGTSSKIHATKPSAVSEVKNSSGNTPSANKNVKIYTGSLKRDAVICPISPDSEVELPGPEENINSPHSSTPSSVTSEGASSKIHATTKPSVVPEIKNNSESVSSTDKNVKKYTGSLKKDAVLCSMSDSDTESHCSRENVNSPHSSISSSVMSEGTSSEIHATTKPSAEVKKNSGNTPSAKKNVRKYTGCLKRDAIIYPLSSDSEDELPGPEENINSPYSSISSSVTSEGTSSRIHATTKPSVVSEIKNNSESAPSTDKNVKKYTGSLKKDAVLCSMSDSDTESHCSRENVNSLQNSISVNEVLKSVPGVSDTVYPPPQRNINSSQNSISSSKSPKSVPSVSDTDSTCLQGNINSLRNSTSVSEAPKSVSGTANNDGESDISSKATFDKEFMYFTGRPTPYVLQQRELFKRIALTPEEITEAYLELQEPLPIHTWFTEELFFRRSPLICLTDSPDVARITNYMNLV